MAKAADYVPDAVLARFVAPQGGYVRAGNFAEVTGERAGFIRRRVLGLAQ